VIVLVVIALMLIGSVSLIVSGLAKLFRSLPDSGGTHINVTINNSFNGRTDDHGTNRKTEAADGEFSAIFNRINRY
jgi:hypothetical protein